MQYILFTFPTMQKNNITADLAIFCYKIQKKSKVNSALLRTLSQSRRASEVEHC